METSLRARHLSLLKQTDDRAGLPLPFVAVRCLLALLMGAHLVADPNHLIPWLPVGWQNGQASLE